MERSKLEDLQDKALFFFIKKIKDQSVIDMESAGFARISDDVAKLFGLGRLDYVDLNYIVATYRLNVPSVWESLKLEKELYRPQAKLYSYQFYERRVEHIEVTYELEITSYAENLVNETIDTANSDGNLDWWEGREVDREYFDSDTTDVGLVKNSIREIEE